MKEYQHNLASSVLGLLREVITAPETELNYTNPYELLISVILSAQCTDARVNQVTPEFFERFPDAKALSFADNEEIYPYIQSISYPNNKAKSLAKLGKQLMESYQGKVPNSIEEMEKLAGVGHKTAQVVGSVAFDIPALPVDTHVFRVSNRIGVVVNADTVKKVEDQLKSIIPIEDWSEAHHLLILHGRYTCTAKKPKCISCPLTECCTYFKQLQQIPKQKKGLDKKAGTYFCGDCDHYFDSPILQVDAQAVEQIACPSCTSMNVFETKNGISTQIVKDYRIK